MRTLVPALLLAGAISACRCGPDEPTPVTLRIKNATQSAAYVNATDGRMGLKIKRRVAGEWLPFVEAPACECLACDVVCDAPCTCVDEDPSQKVMKIAAGGAFERQWAGQVQVSGTGSCQGSIIQGPPCLTAENPPVDETFRLELCYAPSVNGAEQAAPGEIVRGTLPAGSTLCVERPFQVRDGVVEIGPERGADCQAHADCGGEDELCFLGGCTRACPETGFPELGGAWQVRVAEPDDQGFFAWQVQDGLQRYDGEGTVGSVRYENDTMTLSLRRTLAGGGTAIGAVYVTLPRGVAAPFTVGEQVSVTVIDASAPKNPDNRGIVIRDGQGVLILAAETAQKGRVLAPELLAPFTVERGAEELVGCRHTECGKRLHHRTRFTIGEQAVALEPGKTADLVAAAQTWRLANVANARYAQTHCQLEDVMPWAVVNLRPDIQGP